MSGILDSIGLGVEGGYGTFVAPTRHFPVISQDFMFDRPDIESDGRRAGLLVRHPDDFAQGLGKVSGSMEMELYTGSVGMLLRAALGGLATTGVGPFTHTLTPSFSTVSLSAQIGRGVNLLTPTIQRFDYSGMIVTGCEVSCTSGETAKISCEMIGAVQSAPGTAIVAPSYTTGILPMSWAGATIGIDSIGQVQCNEVTVSMTRNVDEDRKHLGNPNLQFPLTTDGFNFEVSGVSEFADLTLYNKFLARTTVPWSFAVASGASSVTFSGSGRLTVVPKSNGTDINTVEWMIQPQGTANATALTCVVVSTDGTA
jgi:hypothetical protein